MTKYSIALIISAVTSMTLFGCGGGGGGGGGGATADITGRVLFVGTGSPVVGAAVSAGGGQVQTDAQGGFTLRGVPASNGQLKVTASGIKTLTQPLSNLTASTLNDLGDIFALDSSSAGAYSATVSGTVVRADNQQAITGALVHLSGQGFTTGADGSFHFSGMPVGLGGTDVPVGVIKAQGFEDKPVFIDPPLGQSPPDNALGTIPMSPPVGAIPGGPADIVGAVTLQGSSDPSGTIVTLTDSGGNTVGRTSTGTDGKYGFYVVAGTYKLHFDHAGYAVKDQSVTLPRPDKVQTVNVTLTPT